MLLIWVRSSIGRALVLQTRGFAGSIPVGSTIKTHTAKYKDLKSRSIGSIPIKSTLMIYCLMVERV